MTVKIGHARIDERGKIAGGKPGDQTGSELANTPWYRGNWNVLLRPKTLSLATKLVKHCKAGTANNNIGYSQAKRNTLSVRAKAVDYDLTKIKHKCDTDCSAFMSVCAVASGVNINLSVNAPTTRTMRSVFSRTGQFEVITAPKYLTSSDYLRAGDILVREGVHTVMVLNDGAKAHLEKPSNQSTTPQSPKPSTNYRLVGSAAYRGTSLVEALNKLNINSSYSSRKEIAQLNGISSYTGTAAQNTQLLSLYKKKLLKVK